MALAAFDTLKFANRLKSVGVPFAQAEAEAEVLAEIFEINLRDLATKEDLQREISGLEQRLVTQYELLRRDMDAKHESLRKDMDAKHESLHKDIDAKFVGVDVKLERMKFDLVKWIIGIAITNFAFLIGILWQIISTSGTH